MAEIRPFKGVLYNQSIIEDLSTVVAPPYDVIGEEAHKTLLKNSKYNVVRLELPQGSSADGSKNNKYARAWSTYSDWLEKGVLVRDLEPSIYVYEQEYEVRGVTMNRIGFIALTRVEDFSTGKIKAHERTLKGPKADRLRLMRACGTNFSQIFSLFSDPEKKVDAILRGHTNEKPRVDIEVDGIIHRLWTIGDPAVIDEIQELVLDKPLYIADGHHRYETAINYRDEMRKATGDDSGEGAFDFTMMMFVNMESEGLTILPTHRMLKNLPKINNDKFRANLEHVFEVEKMETVDKVMAGLAANADKHSIGVYMGNGTFYLLTLKNEAGILQLLDGPESKAWKLLDVTMLHHVIINRVLGFGGTNIENSIKFTTDENEAVELVTGGTYQMAFFLNPTKVDDVRGIAGVGEIMPQKSTYFYPKLLSGLVFNRLEW
ncbi:MAG: DUF1015 domain-containing protein [Candidatus Aquicultor sp.]|nr:DUF1015 domain-containing protein [Candidatus Aquicultor sp.]